jgi:hypothetical protein
MRATGRLARLAFTPFAQIQMPSSTPPRGVRNAWAVHRARGARSADTAIGTPGGPCTGHGPAAARRSKRRGLHEAARPGSRYCALRSARGWILSACCMSPGIAAFVDTCLVRTDCRPDIHLDRPPVAPASVTLGPAAPGRSIRNPRGPRARHRSGHPHPALRDENGHDAAPRRAGWAEDKSNCSLRSIVLGYKSRHC